MTAAALPDRLLLGTSSFSSKDWKGVFYPADLPDAEMLRFYSTKYPVVEIDSTFYGIPAEKTVLTWREKTAAGFLIAAKVPQVITHEKLLLDAEDEMDRFLARMASLGDRLGPLLFQFPYFKKGELGLDEFATRLRPFLARLPGEMRFAVEVRNKTFVTPMLLDLLSERRVALALIDHPWFERPSRLLARHDVVTADFVYVRWLGDRYKIEGLTKKWDRVVVDRSKEIAEWVDVIRKLIERNVTVYAFANNHFSGNAPATLEGFREAFLGQRLAGPR